jgi:hypothetical protein
MLAHDGVGLMSVQLPLQYEQVIGLVDQLTLDEQQALIQHLLVKNVTKRSLTIDEKLALLDAMRVTGAILEEPSIRREDWYGDDGR